MRRMAIAIVLLGLVAIAWTIAWFVAAHRTEGAIDIWLADERLHDRHWTCASRRTAGFPLGLEIECASPAFASRSGPIQSASAQRLTAAAGILSPFEIVFTVHGPLKVVHQNASATFSWDGLEGAMSALSGAPDLSIHARGLQVNEASAEAAAWRGASVQNFRARAQRAPDRAPGADARVVTITLAGVKASPLDSFFGNEDLLSGSLSAILMNAGMASPGNFAERLDKWIAADGRLQVNAFAIEKGASRAEASGNLTLDDRRRPAGQLSVRMSGLQPILGRLNLPAAPLAIEGLLRGSGTRAGGVSLLENRTIPVELRGGRLYIGPIRTPIVIPPLI